MCSGWCNNWVTRQHAPCNNENILLIFCFAKDGYHILNSVSLCCEEMGKYGGKRKNIKIQGWSNVNVKRGLETEHSEEDFAVPGIYSENEDERQGQYRLLLSPSKATFSNEEQPAWGQVQLNARQTRRHRLHTGCQVLCGRRWDFPNIYCEP